MTDEALALLIWENQEERWLDMVASGTNKSLLPGKYTDGGVSRVRTGRSRKGKGWSTRGVRRFNELCKLVENDRNTDERRRMEAKFLKDKQDEEMELRKNKRKRFSNVTYADDEDDSVKEIYVEKV